MLIIRRFVLSSLFMIDMYIWLLGVFGIQPLRFFCLCELAARIVVKGSLNMKTNEFIFFGNTLCCVLSQNIKTKSLRVCLFETTPQWLVYFGVIGNLKPYEFQWDACVKQFHAVSIRGHVVSEAWLSSDHFCLLLQPWIFPLLSSQESGGRAQQ